MNWSTIWYQAISGALLKGKVIGKNKTVCFTLMSVQSGNALRFTFCNRNANYPYEVGEMAVIIKGKMYPVTLNGQKKFFILPGQEPLSDPVEVPIQPREPIEVRIFYQSYILDTNMSETSAARYKGNVVSLTQLPKEDVSIIEKALKATSGVPIIEKIEVATESPSSVILAFGDSITAMGRWVRPLSERLYKVYGGKYVLLNAGISGNCWLTIQNNIFAPVFGKEGIKRAAWDVFSQNNLHTVIFGLGVNDLACLNKNNQSLICEKVFAETLAAFSDDLHKRGIRIVVQTITPRCGCSLGKFTPEMEELRRTLNNWIRSCELFDYVFDADAIVRNPQNPSYYDDRYHQGDYLHPNVQGGLVLAEGFELLQLVGNQS